jgi:hypothetical protein
MGGTNQLPKNARAKMSLTISEDYHLNLKVGQLQNLLPLNDH